ncbi:MAG TPA: winged helix-turn-helix domain-containing protein [Solirubrobacteraceae bacterium]|jgi:DNA-binding transcriptional ArsR family regulator|nr:winged helix-turn-helix domain-containing protein [Solirubrobacteraceae bacterium]
MPNQEPVTNITDPRWLRAISHPIRIRLLAMLDEDAASPVILASKLNQPLGTIAYHVRTLYDLGLLKLVSTRQRRGATEHYYKATGHPASSEEAWEGLDAISKQRLLTALIAKATDYATRSAAAGGFDAGDAHISTDALKLDRTGWEQLARESKKWLARAQEIERESAQRLDAAADQALSVGLTLMLFEALPFSAAVPESSGESESGNGNGAAPARAEGSTSG